VAAGALTLASNAKKFTLDEARKVPLDVTLYALKEVNSLVEEFMLLANCSVATKIAQSFPQFALLRRHPTPPKERFEKLVQVAKLSGFDIKVGSSRQLADSLDKCVVKDFPMFNRLIRTVATRCMTTAVYFITSDVSKKEFRHYGLAAPMYTHFTSPIRRYADIVVHRLLAASIGLSSLPSYCRNKEGMKMTCLNINHRKSMADLVSRASGELFTMIFFKNNPCEADAVISAIRKNGIRVLVPRYGAEGAIKLFESDPNADDGDAEDSSAQLVHAEPETKAAVKGVQFDEDSMVLRTANKEYRMFDRCRVKIYVKETALKRQYLVMELV
jgi:exosome complex exonuclease DIS3/RRP44